MLLLLQPHNLTGDFHSFFDQAGPMPGCGSSHMKMFQKETQMCFVLDLVI